MDLLGEFGSLFSGVASIFNTNSTNKANARENARNRQFNHDEAELARQFNHDEATLDRDWQEKMVASEREWNSYSNQVQLMKDAGINPYNAISGLSGSAVSSSSSAHGSQASGPAASAPSSHAMQSADMSVFADVGLKMAQARNLDSDTFKKKSETVGQDIKNSLDSFTLDLTMDTARLEKKLDLDAKQFSNDLTKIRTDVEKSVLKLNEYNLNYIQPKQLGLLSAQILTESSKQGLLDSQSAKTDMEIKQMPVLLGIQSGLYFATSANLWKDIQVKDANIGLMGSQADYYGALGSLTKTQGRIQGFEADKLEKFQQEYYDAFKGEMCKIISDTSIFIGDKGHNAVVGFLRGLGYVREQLLGNSMPFFFPVK